MEIVKLRDVEIGIGSPKIIVPIVGRSREEILARAQELTNIPLHVVEWRVDFYQDVNDLPSVLSTLRALREALGNIPILFTFRTRKEGGERELPPDRYTKLNLAAALSGDVDAVDVEIFSGDSVVRENIDGIHQAGRIVVGSNHDFQRTPSQADLIFRLRKMQDMGADIPKIAVMPQSAGDVLTLLSATEEMTRCYADRPIITMSMSSQGVVSRLCGEVFGSSMTFGAVGQVSAPGQIPVDQLRQVLEILHNSL